MCQASRLWEDMASKKALNLTVFKECYGMLDSRIFVVKHGSNVERYWNKTTREDSSFQSFHCQFARVMADKKSA